jgi:hypothetical protein
MNLKRLTGGVYQITKQTIPAKFGTISVHAPGILRVTAIDAATASRLAELPNVGMMNDGSAICAPSEFDAIAAVMQPKRKRKCRPMTAERRAKLLAAGAKHRFKAAV